MRRKQPGPLLRPGLPCPARLCPTRDRLACVPNRQVLEWGVKHYDVKFILKTDDDAFINVQPMIQQLQQVGAGRAGRLPGGAGKSARGSRRGWDGRGGAGKWAAAGRQQQPCPEAPSRVELPSPPSPRCLPLSPRCLPPARPCLALLSYPVRCARRPTAAASGCTWARWPSTARCCCSRGTSGTMRCSTTTRVSRDRAPLPVASHKRSPPRLKSSPGRTRTSQQSKLASRAPGSRLPLDPSSAGSPAPPTAPLTPSALAAPAVPPRPQGVPQLHDGRRVCDERGGVPHLGGRARTHAAQVHAHRGARAGGRAGAVHCVGCVSCCMLHPCVGGGRRRHAR